VVKRFETLYLFFIRTNYFICELPILKWLLLGLDSVTGRHWANLQICCYNFSFHFDNS